MSKRKISEALKGLFEDLGEDAARERIIDYIIRELRRGRELEAILNDQFIVNRLSEHDQESILHRTEIIATVGKELEDAFAKLREEVDEESAG